MRKGKPKVGGGLPPFRVLFFFSVLTMALGGCLFYTVLHKPEPVRMIKRSLKASMENVDYRREIAAQLADLTRELNNLKATVDPHIPLRLNALIGQLDPRYALSDFEITTLHSVRPRSEVCAEEYLGPKHGFPFYQEGFITSPSCVRKKPISELVSILLNFAEDFRGMRLEEILQGIRGFHSHLPIIMSVPAHGFNRSLHLAKKYHHVQVLEVQTKDMAGKVWNNLVAEVKTPYVLVARDLAYFNPYVRLERQMYVISTSASVAVAGGAFRNLTGHWKVGCHQTEIKNFFLRFFEGYRYSANDCMFCDHLEGPFVTKTKVLKEVAFSETLPGDVLFEDWFLQVKHSGLLTVNCPDVMYFTQGNGKASSQETQKRRQNSWLALARHWDIHRVFLPPNILYLFSCKEVGLSCDGSKWAGYLLPSCCLVQVARTLRALDDFSAERGLRYEFQGASLLGAVKLKSMLPWDSDGHVTFDSKDYATYYKSQAKFRAKGMKLDSFDPVNGGGIFKLRSPDVAFVMQGSETISTVFLPGDVREIPTRVSVLGTWVRGQANPGLYARNRFGPNYLKHGQVYNETWSSWVQCPNKYHHACLDKYPNDGNVDFVPQTIH